MILKMNINMADITEKTENGELVTNRDQLVVVQANSQKTTTSAIVSIDPEKNGFDS